MPYDSRFATDRFPNQVREVAPRRPQGRCNPPRLGSPRRGPHVARETLIAWTDHTFNIAWGCVTISPGCANCYANALSSRYGFNVWGGGKPSPHALGEVLG